MRRQAQGDLDTPGPGPHHRHAERPLPRGRDPGSNLAGAGRPSRSRNVCIGLIVTTAPPSRSRSTPSAVGTEPMPIGEDVERQGRPAS